MCQQRQITWQTTCQNEGIAQASTLELTAASLTFGTAVRCAGCAAFLVILEGEWKRKKCVSLGFLTRLPRKKPPIL